MLRIGLGALEQGPIDTVATATANDPAFEGLDFTLSEPVRITGQLSAAGSGSYYWRGALHTTVETSCRRCLAPVKVPLEVPVNILFTEDDQADDPSVYVLPPNTKMLDLSEAVREELILAVPDYVLCREDCAGLMNEGSHEAQHAPIDPRWGPLADLKKKE